MSEFHLRQSHKEITSDNDLIKIILGQKHLTMALSKNNEPYISTVNYYFDPDERYFYFHFSPDGKKIDYLRANPVVWGQVMEDGGYIHGKCDHAYRTVQFKGKVEILEDKNEKIEALIKMMYQLEESPTKEREEKIRKRDMDKVAVGKIIVEGMSGKVNLDD